MFFPSLFRSRDRTKESLALKRLALVLVIAVLAALYPSAAFALPSGTRVQKYKGGLNFPVDMAWVPGSKRIFVTEKAGRIRIINKGRLRARACRRINVSSSGERGLLGIELHPNFKRNRYLYAFYVNASPLESRVTRYKVKKGRCRSARNSSRTFLSRPVTTSGARSSLPAASCSSAWEMGTAQATPKTKTTASERSCAITPTAQYPKEIRSRAGGTAARCGATVTATASA